MQALNAAGKCQEARLPQSSAIPQMYLQILPSLDPWTIRNSALQGKPRVEVLKAGGKDYEARLAEAGVKAAAEALAEYRACIEAQDARPCAPVSFRL